MSRCRLAKSAANTDGAIIVFFISVVIVLKRNELRFIFLQN